MPSNPKSTTFSDVITKPRLFHIKMCPFKSVKRRKRTIAGNLVFIFQNSNVVFFPRRGNTVFFCQRSIFVLLPFLFFFFFCLPVRIEKTISISGVFADTLSFNMLSLLQSTSSYCFRDNFVRLSSATRCSFCPHAQNTKSGVTRQFCCKVCNLFVINPTLLSSFFALTAVRSKIRK